MVRDADFCRPLPAAADPQTRLLGFIGRDPSWQPDQSADRSQQ
jgi:hypothetical protein